jgi:hypothetical protein
MFLLSGGRSLHLKKLAKTMNACASHFGTAWRQYAPQNRERQVLFAFNPEKYSTGFGFQLHILKGFSIETVRFQDCSREADSLPLL